MFFEPLSKCTIMTKIHKSYNYFAYLSWHFSLLITILIIISFGLFTYYKHTHLPAVIFLFYSRNQVFNVVILKSLSPLYLLCKYLINCYLISTVCASKYKQMLSACRSYIVCVLFLGTAHHATRTLMI